MRLLCAVLTVVATLGGLPVRAQRIVFPTALEQTPQTPQFAPGSYQYSNYAAPAFPTAPQYPTAPVYGTPNYGVPPASIEGMIPPAGMGWDPYGDPTGQSPAMLPGGGYIQPDGTIRGPQRLVQEIRARYTWLYGGGGKGFGTNDVDLSVTAGFPFLWNASPLLVTPGFTFHWWEGPKADGFDLPPRVYDAYLDAAWKPVVTPWLSGDLGARVGVYSDFDKVNSDSIRIMGKGLGIFNASPNLQVAVGVVYLDRSNVKLLPSGGLIWSPTPDARYEILFPNPKLSTRMTTVGNTDLWLYVAGEYGGGEWTVERLGPITDRVTYNDIRVLLGVEWVGLYGMKGHFEVGYVFDREILYVESPTPDFKPSDTVLLRAGISF